MDFSAARLLRISTNDRKDDCHPDLREPAALKLIVSPGLTCRIIMFPARPSKTTVGS